MTNERTNEKKIGPSKSNSILDSTLNDDDDREKVKFVNIAKCVQLGSNSLKLISF